MFGHHKEKRARKKLKQQQQDLDNKQKQWDAGAPERIKADQDAQNAIAAENAAKASADRDAAKAKGRKDVEDLLSDPTIQGLPEETRKALQYEASKQIQRSHQAANRKLLGEQGQRGIVGKGGVGYAQQRDLQRLANDAQSQATRDLNKLNEDARLKRVAAIFAGQQGEASQAQLDKQMALDELKYEEEKRRNRYYEEQANRQFSRV